MPACRFVWVFYYLKFLSVSCLYHKQQNKFLKNAIVRAIFFGICLTIKCPDFWKISATDHFITWPCFDRTVEIEGKKGKGEVRGKAIMDLCMDLEVESAYTAGVHVL